INNGVQLEYLIRHLTAEYGEQAAKTLMCDFCLHSVSDELPKYAMEYFYISGHYDELQMLIDKNNESTNESNRTWAKVYQLSKDRYIKKTAQSLSPRDILEQAKNIQTDEPALIC